MKNTIKHLFIVLSVSLTSVIYSQEYAKETQLEEPKIVNEADLKDIPFVIIGEAPIHPNCEKVKGKRYLKECLNLAMIKHVQKHFDASLGGCVEKKWVHNRRRRRNEEICIGLKPGKKRIFITFIIDKEGDVTDINVKATHSTLEKEGIKIAKLLPKMKPGKKDGIPVRVRYTLPITFNVE